MARTRPTSTSDALDALLCFDLYAASRAMTRRYRPLLEALGLTYPQYLVVVVLGTVGPSTIKELAGTLRLDHATLAPLLRRMESAGVLTREPNPADARSSRLELTAEGRALHARADDIQCTIRDDLDLSSEQVRELQLALRHVAGAVERGLATGRGS